MRTIDTYKPLNTLSLMATLALVATLTVGCAGIFMCIKAYEYTHKFEEGLLPGIFYHHHGDLIAGSQAFQLRRDFRLERHGHGGHVIRHFFVTNDNRFAIGLEFLNDAFDLENLVRSLRRAGGCPGLALL